MPLEYKVFRHSYRGFNSNSVLVYGENDAILIDASQLLSDSYRLVAELIPMRKRITHIYVSHFHPDHHFGLEVLDFAFPRAKIVSVPSVVKDILFTSTDKVDMWGDSDWVGSETPAKTTIPMPMAEPRLEVEGEEILFFDDLHGDSTNNSVAWIPSLRTLYASDVIFHDCNLWVGESTVERRVKWRKDIERLRDFDPRIVIPGHCGETQMQVMEEVQTQPSWTFTEGLAWCREYLDVYDDVYHSATSGADFVDKMLARYGHVKAADFCIHWEARLLFPRTSPDWLTPLPGPVGHIFLNPDGGYDGDPPRE